MTDISAIHSPAPKLDKILKLEAIIGACEQVEMPPVHYFSEGIYAREITIPKGTVLTGKMHKTEHINVVSKGEITVWTEEGMKRVRAPFTFVSKPGTKRVGYAHEETVWTTFHPNPENGRDLLSLEDALIIPANNQLEGASCLG
jgi:quercetin dioxygenase-like cupin family protein